MQFNVLKLLFVIFLLNSVISPVYAEDSVLRIINPRSDTLLYCSNSIPVAGEITVENIVVDKSSDGMKVSIVKYNKRQSHCFFDGVKFYYRFIKKSLTLKQIIFSCVILSVMKTTDKSNYKFERKSRYRNLVYFSDVETSSRIFDSQAFVVPWQMVKTKESKYLIQ